MTRTFPFDRVSGKESKRFGKFLIVGAVGFIVDFGVFNLEHALGLGRGVAEHVVPASAPALRAYLSEHPEVLEQSLSFAMAVLSNFLWNWLWVYPEARGANQAHKILKFVVVSVAGLIIGIPVFSLALFIFKGLMAAAGQQNAGFNLAGNLALMTRVGVLLFWNFFVNRYWTYRDVA
jgi:putative flippase GtrA